MASNGGTKRAPVLEDVDCVMYQGHALSVLRELDDESIDCCVTSPPYWGLRDYGVDGQIGLEDHPDIYVANLVAVFREVHRVLAGSGTLWLNLGDSYSHGGNGSRDADKWPKQSRNDHHVEHTKTAGGKPKDLLGMPWRVALALQEDGWWLRSDVIWSKPNPMPESISDRPTKAHEYVFLLSKSPSYYFGQEDLREMYAPASEDRYRYAFGGPKAEALAEADKDGIGVRTRPIGMREYKGGLTGGAYAPPGQAPHSNARGPDGRRKTTVEGADGSIQHRDGERWPNGGRNVRSVWEIPTQPYPEAHFAVFPEELARRMILGGCPPGGTVLDPFGGSGTTALVARRFERKSVLIELNPAYCVLAGRRLAQQSLLAEAL